MAMTKAEKARVEELETALALCWPGYAEPKPMTREEIEAAKVEIPRRDHSVRAYGASLKAAVGWFFNDYSNGSITKGWSSGATHNRDSEYGDHGSQNMGRMYRTKAEAAMALRIALSKRYAEALASVDRIIRDESAN